MNESPSSWVYSTLEKVGLWSSGGTPKRTIKDYYDGPIPWLVIGDLNDGLVTSSKNTITESGLVNSSAKLLKEGTLLIAMYGSIGKLGIAGVECATNQAIASCVVDNQIVSRNYLFYFLMSRRKHLLSLGKGGAQQNISQTVLKAYEVPLAPLNEQIRIANKLDSLLAKVDDAQTRLEKIPSLLKRFRQSVLAAATSGELTREWRAQNVTESICELVEWSFSQKMGKLKVRAKKGWDVNLQLQTLPDNWAWIPNFKLAKGKSTAICAGPFGTIFKAKDFRDQGVPIIFLRHVKESGFNQNKPNYMDPDVWKKLHQDYSVHGGELLVTKLGDPPGEACIYPQDFGAAMVTPDVIKMDVDESVAYTEYLKFFFNSPNCKNMLRELAFGATRLRIDIPMFKNFPIPLPPINEQNEIVRRVGSLFALADSVEKQYTEAKKRIDRLTQSLLAKAFRGELVPQEPNDEPAAELLKRIEAERKHLTESKPKRKATTNRNDKNATKSKGNNLTMKLSDAPENYLLDQLKHLGGEADAKLLWNKTELDIDDFYAKLKQEMLAGNIIDDKTSPDASQRKLKVLGLDNN
ncbi:restriction endonuclease subunit S [Methylophilus sp. DW102]|uniref:restriction endonuclease subunit S n=1 Tax=Methylophilus sp. DW102 TaxID=3095607 RepID=UPI00308FD8A6|nr:restriction endonuclease subunit S [Methylophilus sp. DW102]